MARHVKVTYSDGEAVEGDQKPFDTVTWERHFNIGSGALGIKVEAETGRLESEGMDPDLAATLAMETFWLTEHDVFYAYAICRRLGLHRELEFDDWGATLESVEWSQAVTADPLAPTPPSSS